MAILYTEIRRLVRFKTKDINEIENSDYDIKMAVNEAIRYMSNSLALQNSDFLEKKETFAESDYPAPYSFKSDGVELPEDFIALVSVSRAKDDYIMQPVELAKEPNDCEYMVRGNKVYCGTGAFKLTYRAALAEIKDEEDSIELPNMFKDALVKLVVMILRQAETDILLKAVDDAMYSLVPKRRYRNAKIRMPFMV